MADPQLAYKFAWALEVLGPATIRRATTDLMEAAAVTTLGDFYKKGLKSIDTRILESLPSLFYGVRKRSGFQVILSNADGDMDTTAEWRGSAFTLWHYDRELDVKRADLVGLVTDAQFANGQCTMQLDTVDTAILQQLLPAATINPEVGTPFENAGTGGAGLPLPVIFGDDVLIEPPPIRGFRDGDGEFSTYDYALGFGSDIILSNAWAELDRARAGLEQLHNWVNAAGSPAYLSTELDPHRRATHFAVTGDQSVRYTLGMPIRFRTTASGSKDLYSVVRAYHNTTTPHQVELYDARIGAGLSNVQVAGDFAVVRDVYTTVTAGILPVPDTEQQITALRLFGLESSVTALVSNPNYPSGTGGALPSNIIRDIIGNPVWGLSTRVQQVTDTGTFAAAGVALSLAGLDGVVQGGLGWDGVQVQAEQVLDWLCMIARGGRLGKNALGRWTLAVDSAAVGPVATFVFGQGLESGTRIKRVISYGRTPLDRAVRNMVLHWSPGGRARSGVRKLQPQAYSRISTKAVSGLGQDRDFFNPFIRSANAAELVVQYMAEMLKGADEQLVFTAGPEARDRVVGEVITAISTVDGFSGEWKIIETSRSLTDVQISCIRYRSAAYDTPTGIVHSSPPGDSPNTRTSPTTGPNMLGNPEPSPPVDRHGQYVAFTSPTGPIAVGSRAVARIDSPHGWGEIESLAGPGLRGKMTELTMDASEAIRSRTASGHYVRMTWERVHDNAPTAEISWVDGLFADQVQIKAGTDYMFSFYGDVEDGWYVVVYQDTSWSGVIVPIIRDDTDTDGNGWERFYGRFRPVNGTTRIIPGIAVSKPGTYQWSSAMLTAVTGSARKPPEWSGPTTQAIVLHRFSDEITLDGSDIYRVQLIQAGDYAIGADLRVTGEINWGTAVQFAVGTDADPEVWARRVKDPFAHTSSANYRDGSVAAFYSEDEDIVVTFTKADGSPGTATSGKFRIDYSFSRSFPTPGL